MSVDFLTPTLCQYTSSPLPYMLADFLTPTLYVSRLPCPSFKMEAWRNDVTYLSSPRFLTGLPVSTALSPSADAFVWIHRFARRRRRPWPLEGTLLSHICGLFCLIPSSLQFWLQFFFHTRLPLFTSRIQCYLHKSNESNVRRCSKIFQPCLRELQNPLLRKNISSH